MWRATRVPIRIKLAATLAVPLLALVVVGVAEVVDMAQEVSEVRGETQLARASTGPAGLITRLQDERTWATVELIGLQDAYAVPMAGYAETRDATDQALDAFRHQVESAGGAVEATYRDALGSLGALDTLRRDLDATPEQRSLDNMSLATGFYDRYTELVDGLLDANSRIAPQVDDTQLRAGTSLADLASRQVELEAGISRTTVVDAMLTPGGIDERAEVIEISTLMSEYQDNNRQILRATGPYAAIVREHFPTDQNGRLEQNVASALEAGTIADVQGWMDDIRIEPDVGYGGLRDAVLREVTTRAEALNDRANARQWLFGGLTFAGLVLAILVTWLVSRSITRPLRSLTTQARDMAGNRLPEAVLDILDAPLGEDVRVPHLPPVSVETRDEVADVSVALTTVQESALDLAVEQAVLRRNIADSFVNLGRRNQNLLGRQLDFLTHLESRETDPDTLGALYRLDHLATRMRRNAESLLVLAGIEPPRTWTSPVRLAGVVRSAVGEVEDYRRVRVEGLGPVTVVGAVAADLAHLLAELVENALTASRPSDDVAVRGAWAGRDTFRLVVIDRGVGMSPAAYEQANRRLAQGESFTVAPSKYLGHYVAGSLAARHGIGLRLDPAASGGVVATVDLPAHLLTSERAAPVAGPAPRVSPPRRAAAGPGAAGAVPA